MKVDDLHFNSESNLGKRVDIFFIVAGSLFSLIIGYLLIFDVSLFAKKYEFSSDHQESIATLSVAENQVRKKSASIPIWNHAHQNEKLFLDDQIFTDENSRAQISFSSKAKIDINQNSLVIVRKSEKENQIQVKKGAIYARFDEPGELQLMINDKKPKIAWTKNTEIEIKVDQNHDVNINVLSGEVELRSAKKKLNLSDDDIIGFNSQGDPDKLRKANISLIIPTQNANIILDDSAQLVFKWKSSLRKTNYQIEFGEDQTFKNPFKSILTDDHSVKISAKDLNSNVIYWRLVAHSDNGDIQFSGTRRLSLIRNSGPKLIYPDAREEFAVIEQEDKFPLVKNVYFDWQVLDGVKSYELQLSQERDFRHLVHSTFSETNSHSSEPLKPGKYYWRVRGLVDDKKLNWSQTSSFQITLINLPLPPDPKTPQDNEEIYLADNNQNVIFQWSPSDSVAHHLVQISSNPNFSEFQEHQVSDKEYQWKAPLHGVYYWRVKGVDYYDRSTKFSRTRKFEVKANSTIKPPKLELKYHILPQNKPVIKKEQTLRDFLRRLVEDTAYAEELNETSMIKWDAVKEAASYDVQVAKDTSFSNIVLEKNVTLPMISLLGLDTGKYYLRIRTVLVSGAKGDFSPASEVYVVYPKINLIKPDTQQKFRKRETQTPVTFSWETVPGVSNYVFELHTNPSFDNPIIKLNISENETIRMFTKVGAFYWRVGFSVGSQKLMQYSEIRLIIIYSSEADIPQLDSIYHVTKPEIKNVQEPLSLPIVKRAYAEHLSLSIGLMPTRTETVSTYESSRDSLVSVTYNSLLVNGSFWTTKKIGFIGHYNILSTQVIKESASQNAQTINSTDFRALIQYQFLPELLAETHICPRLGYGQFNIVSLSSFDSETFDIAQKKFDGVVTGFGVERALTSPLWFKSSLDHFRASGTQFNSIPIHFIGNTSAEYLLNNGFKFGLGYGIEFGKYNFRNGISPGSKEIVSFRKQSFGLLLGYTI